MCMLNNQQFQQQLNQNTINTDKTRHTEVLHSPTDIVLAFAAFKDKLDTVLLNTVYQILQISEFVFVPSKINKNYRQEILHFSMTSQHTFFQFTLRIGQHNSMDIAFACTPATIAFC